MIATGDLGILKVGYQRAVTIRRWSLTLPDKQEEVGVVVATVVGRVESVDQYWSTIPPTKLGLWMGTAWWVWNQVRVIEPAIISRKSELQVMGNPEVKLVF